MIHQKQRLFLDSNKFIVGYVGGRGSGKTKIGAIKVIHDSRDGHNITAVSPTFAMIEDNTLPVFIESAKERHVFIRKKMSPYPQVWFRTPDKGVAVVGFRSGEDPEKLRGPSRSMLWLDEASIMSSAVRDIGIAILRYKGKMGRMLVTMTPRGRLHWTFKQFFQLTETPTDSSRLFGSSWYDQIKNTDLIQSHSAENPFLAEEYVDLVGQSYSAVMREQELGGNFVDIVGLLFDRANFPIILPHQVPRPAIRIRYWDRACTPGSGSYTSGCLLSAPVAEHTPYPFIVENVIRGQWGPADRDAVILKTAREDADKYGNEVVIYIEMEGGSGGKEIGSIDVKKLAGFPVYLDPVSGKRQRLKDGIILPGEAKVIRAMAAASQVERQHVAIVRGSWNDDFLDELSSFPESSYADQVDAFSGAFNKISDRTTLAAQGVNRQPIEANSIGSRLLQLQATLATTRGS